MGACVTEIDDMLDRWEELCNNATAGPWHRCLMQACSIDMEECCNRSHPNKCGSFVVDFMAKKNLEFAIAARTAMPQLIKAVRYLESKLEETHTSNNDHMIAQDAEIKRLEKEADWLADSIIEYDCPQNTDGPDCQHFGDVKECKKCWRNEAKKAVNDD